MLPTKLRFIWPSGFREDFLKRLQTNNNRRTDGRQVMAITHMAFWPGELIKVWIGLFRTGQ